MADDMSKVKGFFLYFDQYEPLDDLTDEQCGQLMKAMFAKFQGREFEFTDPVVKIAYKFFEATFKREQNRYNEKSEKARESANRRWNKGTDNDANDANACERIQTHTNACERTKGNANDAIIKPRIKEEEKSITNVILVDSEAADMEQGTLLDATESKPKSIPDCPHEKIVALYHEHLPELRRVKTWTGKRAKHLKARWRENWKKYTFKGTQEPSFEGGLDYWAMLFDWIHGQDFLMGKVNSFQADLEWIVNPTNFAKIIESKYVNQREVA